MRRAAGLVACLFALAGCERVRDVLDRSAPDPPAAEAVAPLYAAHPSVRGVEMNGNVVELRVLQPFRQLERGGSLWARVGPYVYLFTPSTREVFRSFPGVAAVRAITVLPNGDEVARATLARDRLSDVRWRRALNILGRALREGQESPRRLEELTEWGEDHTEFSYNPDYVNP
ncbi:MAG TPA: hypothetical protein VMM12_12510 [Longimicrobiales bacterium]|nr:hypothetical protein [Longimicrobiales bacterium]